jgi:hypothetical protein
MDPHVLKALIESDTQAIALAEAGDFFACAARCMVIAEKVRSEKILTERGLLDELGQVMGETILQNLKAVAISQHPLASTLSRFLTWLVPANGGADFGSPKLLALAAQLHEAQVLDQPEYEALASLGLVPPTITAYDVEIARTRI